MSGARLPVIIPIKALELAKQRLSAVLSAAERRQLVMAMLEDVLDVLAQVAGLGPVLVVTRDPDVAALASDKGAEVVEEPADSDGLNGAVRLGLCRETVLEAGQALILPGDVPLATAGELAALVASAGRRQRPRVTLVPARDCGGTNAMLLAPPGVIDPSFGRDSFIRHLASAVARRVDVETLQLPGLGVDVDTPADLQRLLRERRGSRRYEFLRDRVLDEGMSVSTGVDI